MSELTNLRLAVLIDTDSAPILAWVIRSSKQDYPYFPTYNRKIHRFSRLFLCIFQKDRSPSIGYNIPDPVSCTAEVFFPDCVSLLFDSTVYFPLNRVN